MDFALIGLSNRDKRIYEALVRLPQSSIRAIAETVNIDRGSVLESIKALVAVGLVTRVTFGRRMAYRAKDPEILHELIKEKQRELLEAKNALDKYTSKLTIQPDNPNMFHFASSYEGDDGLATILRDVLKTCRRQKVRQYDAISSPRVSTYLYNNFSHFSRERVRQELNVRVLRQGKPLRELMDYASTRYIDSRPKDSGCYTLIYGTKVAVITIGKYNQASGLIVDEESFAAVQRQLFEATWARANKNTP